MLKTYKGEYKMNNNFEDLRTKVNQIVEALEQIAMLLGHNDDKAAAFEVPIDETYSLVAVRGGDVLCIVEGDNVVMDYVPDDEWTIGDIVGGYLDLYFTK